YSDQWLGREPTAREMSEEFRHVYKLLQEAQEKLARAEELVNSRVAVTIGQSGGVRPLSSGARVVSELTAPGQYKVTCPEGWVWVSAVGAGRNSSDVRTVNVKFSGREADVTVFNQSGVPASYDFNLMGVL